MENKIMRIYYGNDCLPYKDEERTIHYPIVGKIGGGSVITGENNTTTIEFYVGLVGSNSKTWVATIKKPDGTLFYRVLNNGVAKDNDYVVSLDIAEIYANQVGNMVVGLNGYDGTTNISEEDDELIISGNTNCLALGTINVLCNYAPQVLTNAYGLDPSDLQLLLTAINQKANKVDTIIVVNQLNNTLEFEDNQIVFSITDKKFYKYVDSETYPNNFVVATDYYSQSEIDALLNDKQNILISGTNIKTINGESILGGGNINIEGGGETYTAGQGIIINNLEISIDDTEVATKTFVSETYATQSSVESIEALIPAQASSSNKLADKDFVNSSIATNTANFLGTYNLVTDLGLTTSATHSDIALAIATKLTSLSITPTNNDYVFVAYPDATVSSQFIQFDRYKYDGSAWEWEYTLNNSSFNAQQWAAINSGITASMIANFATKSEVASGLATKVSKITSTSGGRLLYGNNNGTEANYKLVSGNENNSVIYRDGAGRAKISDPAVALDIANKQYVDAVAGAGGGGGGTQLYKHVVTAVVRDVEADVPYNLDLSIVIISNSNRQITTSNLFNLPFDVFSANGTLEYNGAVWYRIFAYASYYYVYETETYTVYPLADDIYTITSVTDVVTEL